MNYAPINTLLAMEREMFRDDRHPHDDNAVARFALTLPREEPDRLGAAFVKLRDLNPVRARVSRMAQLGRLAFRRAA